MTEKIWASLQPLFQRNLPTNSFSTGVGSGASMTVEAATSNHWKAGDWAIYRKSKRGTVPGPRAFGVKPNAKGETYGYVVDKFWLVDTVHTDGTLTMRTARGKTHRIQADDPNLARPGWLARLRWGERFRMIETQFGKATYAA